MCNYYSKCKLMYDFNETSCTHYEPHEKRWACQQDSCGMLERNNLDVKVCCTTSAIRKEKLNKIDESIV